MYHKKQRCFVFLYFFIYICFQLSAELMQQLTSPSHVLSVGFVYIFFIRTISKYELYQIDLFIMFL
jgi:hypothetical protein